MRGWLVYVSRSFFYYEESLRTVVIVGIGVGVGVVYKAVGVEDLVLECLLACLLSREEEGRMGCWWL